VVEFPTPLAHLAPVVVLDILSALRAEAQVTLAVPNAQPAYLASTKLMLAEHHLTLAAPHAQQLVQLVSINRKLAQQLRIHSAYLALLLQPDSTKPRLVTHLTMPSSRLVRLHAPPEATRVSPAQQQLIECAPLVPQEVQISTKPKPAPPRHPGPMERQLAPMLPLRHARGALLCQLTKQVPVALRLAVLNTIACVQPAQLAKLVRSSHLPAVLLPIPCAPAAQRAQPASTF
jgi:hypothetical protein